MTENFKSKHILHLAKKRIVTPNEIRDFVRDSGCKQHFIGALPGQVITKFSPEKRSKITKSVHKIFNDFSKSVSYITTDIFLPPELNEQYFFDECNKASSKLEKTLNKPYAFIEYLDSGTYKHCFLVNFGDINNMYVLQTFISGINFDKDFYHGVLFEPQNCFTVYEQNAHKRIARPFMTHPTNQEISGGGYILNKYIDPKQSRMTTRGQFISRRDNMVSDDTCGNKNCISGITVDMGGFIKNPERIADKQIRSYWFEFAQILDAMDFYSDNAKYASGYLLKHFNKMGNDFFDTTRWPKMLSHIHNADKLKSAKKMLRSLRRLKLKREKMETIGQYEKVQKLLHQDFIKIFDFLNVNKDFITPYFNLFYPEMVFKILGTDNTPKFEDLISKKNIVWNKFNISLPHTKLRIHWNKYYNLNEIIKSSQKHPKIDFSRVIQDFNKPSFITRLFSKTR